MDAVAESEVEGAGVQEDSCPKGTGGCGVDLVAQPAEVVGVLGVSFPASRGEVDLAEGRQPGRGLGSQ